jgi:hypothetical protein
VGRDTVQDDLAVACENSNATLVTPALSRHVGEPLGTEYVSLEESGILSIGVETIKNEDPNSCKVVVQYDIAGFTRESQRLLSGNDPKSIINAETIDIVSQIGQLGAPLGRALLGALVAEREKAYTTYQLKARNEGSGVMKVADMAFMIADLTVLPRILGLNARLISMEGDMGRFIFDSPEDALLFCNVARSFLSISFKENGLDNLSVRFGMAEVNEPINLYVNSRTNDIVSVSGGVEEVAEVESKTAHGEIGVTDVLKGRLKTTFARNEGDKFDHVVVGDSHGDGLLKKSVQRALEKFGNESNGEVKPMPIAYCKIGISKVAHDSEDQNSQKQLNTLLISQLQKLIDDSGLDGIKFNTIQNDSSGEQYISLICTASGTNPVSQIVDGFSLFAHECNALGFHGVVGVAYGPVWLGTLSDRTTDELTERNDAISPFLNIGARIAQGTSKHHHHGVHLYLHDSVATELFHEGKCIPAGTERINITAKGIPEGIDAYAYDYHSGLTQLPIYQAVEVMAESENPQGHLTSLLSDLMRNYEYTDIDIQEVVRTALRYSGISGRDILEHDEYQPLLINDLKALVTIAIGHIFGFMERKKLGLIDTTLERPSLTSILNEMTKHTWNLNNPRLVQQLIKEKADDFIVVQDSTERAEVNIHFYNSVQRILNAVMVLREGVSNYLIENWTMLARQENQYLEDYTISELDAVRYASVLTLGRVFLFNLNTLRGAFGVPKSVIDNLLSKGVFQSPDGVQAMLNPSIVHKQDAIVHPRVRSELHKKIVLYLLKNVYDQSSDNGELYDQSLYEMSRVCLLHAMYIEDIHEDAYLGFGNIVFNTLNTAWKDEKYSDLLIFGTRFFSFFDSYHPEAQKDLLLKYAYSHLMVGDLEVAKSICMEIIEDDDATQSQLETATLYLIFKALRANHQSIEEISECLVELRGISTHLLSEKNELLRLSYISLCNDKLGNIASPLTVQEYTRRLQIEEKMRV